MTQYAFYFDADKCTGCKTCQVTCKENNHLPVNNLYRKVLDYQGGSWEQTENGHYVPNGVFAYFTSLACNHCTNPACVEVCPTGAMQKEPETGIVWTDHEVCIGCRLCESACPYDAPTYGVDEGYMLKCDMCKGEIEAGNQPFCATACPMRALEWGEYDELVAKYGAGDVEIEPLPVNETGANLIVNPHRNAQKSGTGTGRVVTITEEI